ncbi:MAG: hypothetical protein WAL52_11820, partial [Candidatus Sulfotelmatobacter sp.]
MSLLLVAFASGCTPFTDKMRTIAASGLIRAVIRLHVERHHTAAPSDLGIHAVSDDRPLPATSQASYALKMGTRPWFESVSNLGPLPFTIH